MNNILQEIREILSEHGLTEADISWVGTEDGQYSVSWAFFCSLIQQIEQDKSRLVLSFPDDLVIVGHQFWWITRVTDDWGTDWQYYRYPRIAENASSHLTYVREGRGPAWSIYTLSFRKEDRP